MMHRTIPILIVVGLLFAVAVMAQTPESSSTMPAATSSAVAPAPTGQAPVTGSTTVLFDAVINYYNLDRDTVMALRDRGWGATDIAVAGNIAQRSGRPFNEVVSAYEASHNWTEVATRVGVNPSDIYYVGIGGPVMAGREGDAIERAFIKQEFCLTDAQISFLRARCQSWGDIRLIANTARLACRPLNEIADLRAQGMSWSDIACRYKLKLAALYVTPPCGCCSGHPSRYATGSAAGYHFGTGFGYGFAYGPHLTSLDVGRLCVMGWTVQDIRVAAMIRANSRATLPTLMNLHNGGWTWYQIAATYGIPMRDVDTASADANWLPS